MVDPHAQAQRFTALFGAVYLTFHRRDGPRNELSGASRAVLNHLAMAGPMAVGEAALHLDRAQSVVSEIVTGLERRGLLERETDPRDRRRTLVWLTPAGQDRLRADSEVLSSTHLEQAVATMPPADVDALLAGLADLVAAASPRRDASRPDSGGDSVDNN